MKFRYYSRGPANSLNICDSPCQSVFLCLCDSFGQSQSVTCLSLTPTLIPILPLVGRCVYIMTSWKQTCASAHIETTRQRRERVRSPLPPSGWWTARAAGAQQTMTSRVQLCAASPMNRADVQLVQLTSGWWPSVKELVRNNFFSNDVVTHSKMLFSYIWVKFLLLFLRYALTNRSVQFKTRGK